MRRIYLIITVMLMSVCVMRAQSNDEKDNNIITVTDQEGNEDEIDVPVGMDTEVDSLLQVYIRHTYLKPDTSCNAVDVNPDFPDSVYVDRLRRLPTIIEMPYNSIVRKFIDRYATDLRGSVGVMIGASNFYMPLFEQALDLYNIPLELKYLPVIESALNPNAVSRVGATGLWQFMLPTAKRYGLEINSLVDERRDPVRASYAAAHYLSDLYRIFDDWSLVIAAYNCGPEKVNKAIHQAKGNADYWHIYPYLPKETRGYVPAFIAANYIMNYYCEHNICPMLSDLPMKTDTVMVDRDVHLQQVADVLKMDIEQLRELNPQYRRDIVNGFSKPRAIKLPATKIGDFIELKDSVYSYKNDELILKRDTVDVNTHKEVETKKRVYRHRHRSSGRRHSKARRRHRRRR